ncbi:hypothetical protein NDU88_004343 [Pleurodeles waltl]|uniref:Uncharacterized protein n=1 Tax=Pleurodeles waltl TaxID=8319 RepID=A0AAV7WXY8_PLEWA|nr:hypothetical protein NDU88_004343 [Pleurodeles waltl]
MTPWIRREIQRPGVNSGGHPQRKLMICRNSGELRHSGEEGLREGRANRASPEEEKMTLSTDGREATDRPRVRKKEEAATPRENHPTPPTLWRTPRTKREIQRPVVRSCELTQRKVISLQIRRVAV